MNIGSTFALKGKFEVEPMSVVICQVAPISCCCMEEVDENVQQIIDFMDRAAMGFPGFDLFVSPECALQGYGPEFVKALVTLDSPQVKRLCDKCAELGVWGIFNVLLTEYDGHESINMAILVDDKGEIVHKYAKANPWTPVELSYPGSDFSIADGPCGSKLGIIICADGDFPETWRACAVNGANVIVRISHYMAPYDQAWEITNKAGAYQNQVYVVAANTVGLDECYSYFGRSMVVSPDGIVITEAPLGIPWLLKADIYPAIIDNLKKKAGSNSLIYEHDHRGGAHCATGGKGLGLEVYRK